MRILNVFSFILKSFHGRNARRIRSVFLRKRGFVRGKGSAFFGKHPYQYLKNGNRQIPIGSEIEIDQSLLDYSNRIPMGNSQIEESKAQTVSGIVSKFRQNRKKVAFQAIFNENPLHGGERGI